jgi:hypothetical protein
VPRTVISLAEAQAPAKFAPSTCTRTYLACAETASVVVPAVLFLLRSTAVAKATPSVLTSMR